MATDLPSGFAADLPEEMQGLEGILAAISVAAKPFFDEGCDHVVVARHCGKLYVGTVKPERCGSCGEADPDELRIVYVQPLEDEPQGILITRSEPY